MADAAPAVLHVSNTDNLGGSGRSAYKIHTGLRRLGLRSRMLVKTRVTGDPDVAPIHGESTALRLLDAVGREVVDRLGAQYLFYPSSFALQRHPWFLSADVVQLYNTHGGFFSHRALPELSRLKPLVWRLSDMWPLTGHCAYSYDCERWKAGCGSCPLLNEYPGLAWDATALLFRVKQRAYDRSRLTLVATNSWMEGLLRASPLLSRFPVRQIPNGVDAAAFRPLPKREAREALAIPPEARVVLFAAHVALPGTRKGGEHVAEALGRLAARGLDGLALVVMGEKAELWPDAAGYRTIRVPFTDDDHELARAYAAADVLVCPALAENLPNGVLESMACGTPAIAFDTGGVKDVVRHMETGYLARQRDTDDLARGLDAVLRDAALAAALGRRSRALIESRFTVELQARRYAELYRELAPRVAA